MALTELQKRIMRRLALNRSESSYLAGGVILNLDWPRRSDDIDIFHDSDEAVSVAAQKDIADLAAEGLSVTIDIKAYGLFEAPYPMHLRQPLSNGWARPSFDFFP